MKLYRNRYIMVLILSLVVINSSQAQWERVSNFPNQEILDLEVVGDWMYFSSLDRVYRIARESGKIDPLGSAGELIDIKTLKFVGSRLLGGTFSKGIYQSNDSGYTWQPVNIGLSGPYATTITSIVQRGDSVFIGTDGAGVYCSSTRSSIAWEPFRHGLYFNIAWTIYTVFHADDMLFCGAGQNGYIYRNMPESTYWSGIQFNEDIGLGLAMLDFSYIEPGLLAGVAFDGMYLSYDDGLTWSHFPAPFKVASAGRIFYMNGRPMAMLSHLSLGTFIWEWRGGTWELFDHQPGLFINDIVFFNNKLYGAGWDGLRQFPLDPTGVDPDKPDLPDQFELKQNYPNPFNPSTTISFELPEAGIVKLTVINVMGQTVTTLLNDKLSSGQHEIVWTGVDARGQKVASGIYYYRLSFSNVVATKKMVLLK